MGMVWSGLVLLLLLSLQYVWLFVNHVRVGHSFFCSLANKSFFKYISFMCLQHKTPFIISMSSLLAFFSLSSTSSYNCVCRHFFFSPSFLALFFPLIVRVQNGTPPSNFELMFQMSFQDSPKNETCFQYVLRTEYLSCGIQILLERNVSDLNRHELLNIF